MPGTTSERVETLPQIDLLRAVGNAAAALDVEAYVIGGAVRDAMLCRPTTDIDFVTVGAGTGIALAEAVGGALGGTSVHVYPKFGTAAVRIASGEEQVVLEFVAARRESYRSESRKPDVEAGTLDDDLARRDFTVNAMAADIHPDRFGLLIDPFDGQADLQRRLLRTPLDPIATFEDDPLRMVRAARFAAQLDFEVDPTVLAAMSRRAPRVEILSQERITEELHKILCSSRPSVGFALLQEQGLLRRIMPELSRLQGVEAVDGHRHKDNFYHTLQVVDNLVELTQQRPCDDTLWLRWAALLHDVAKPSTKRFVEGSGWTFHGHDGIKGWVESQ